MAQDIGIDFKQVRKEATQQLQEERIQEATKKFKAKIKEVEAARTVLRNLERELDVLEDELQAGL